MFLINLIPLHVLALMITGRFSHRIYVAYCSVSERNSCCPQTCLLKAKVSFLDIIPCNYKVMVRIIAKINLDCL